MSKNPHNHDVTVTPIAKDHPISRGLKPFKASDEFYFRIHFRENDKRVTPIIKFKPAQDPEEQVIAWATQRENGGRSFGFTGGHFHTNWGIPEFRRLVLNAILWTAHVEVPEGGAQSTVTEEFLKKNLDDKGRRRR
jgi:type 1 glutamine amidotransferase